MFLFHQKCGNVPGSDNDCMVNGLSVSERFCASNLTDFEKNANKTDKTCTDVVYQSKCGALKRFANKVLKIGWGL